jgi:hypothetical protein
MSLVSVPLEHLAPLKPMLSLFQEDGGTWKGVTELIALVAGVIGLVVAVINYLEALAKKREQGALAGMPRVRIVQIPERQIKKWPWQLGKWMFLSIGVIFVLYSIWHLIDWVHTDSKMHLAIGVFSLITAVPYYFFFRKYRDRPWQARTPTRRQEEIVVEAEYNILMDQCRTVLRSLRANVIFFDRDGGIIDARTGWSMWSFGEKMRVQILNETGGNRYTVKITSDSRMPVTLYDFGRNSRNVQRFIDLLTN